MEKALYPSLMAFSIFILPLFQRSVCLAQVERTLAMVKPDGLMGNYSEEIKKMIAATGFVIAAEKVVQLDEAAVRIFYAEHSQREFFPSLVKFMTSIRAMCGSDSQNNCVHGSDSHQSAAREVAFFFGNHKSGEVMVGHDEL